MVLTHWLVKHEEYGGMQEETQVGYYGFSVQVLESSRDTGEPATFEIGAGEIMGNQLFKVLCVGCRMLCVWWCC